MNMNLKDREWGEFSLTDIFTEIKRGKRLKKNDHVRGTIPYISSKSENNGIDGFVGNKENARLFTNCLTVANSGSVGACFFQPFEFVASDHITKLENREFGKYVYLFIAQIISRLSEKYSFNREINDLRIKREKIMLPIEENGNPDYLFMEEYMRQKEKEKKESYRNFILKKLLKIDEESIIPLSEKEWGEFFIEDIAKIVSGRDIYENERIEGGIPYVSATALNNGVGYMVGNNNDTFESNCLSVNRNGSVGYSFYHPYKGKHPIKSPF